MHILTILTKRSVREILKERKFLKFYSSQNFTPGMMIEIIDGNKKSPAIILKSEPASDYKEEIRMGRMEIKKLKLSKTGPWAEGAVIDFFDLAEIKKYLKEPASAQKSSNEHIKNFFPKPLKKNEKKISAEENSKKGMADISEILSSKTLKKEKKYNNPVQEMVDTIRNYFGEKARYGYGSFSYYIGMFKQVPERDIWQFFGEAKQSKKSLFQQKKIF